VEQEFGIGTAQAGNEVAFKGLDGSFGGIAAVDFGWDELIVDGLFVQEVLDALGAFIVKTLEAWVEACLYKDNMGAFVGGNGVVGGGASFHGLGMDELTVVVVHDEEVVVAITKRGLELAGLVCDHLAGGGHGSDEALMRTFGVWAGLTEGI
jgi:hypothetical protein